MTLHQQPLLLEDAKAYALDRLAKQLGMTKQELLREAVDDLLAMHNNTGIRSLTVEVLKNALRQSADLIAMLEDLKKSPALPVPLKRKCYETKLAVNDALAEVGIENLL
jgi:hypothetical protein